MDEFFDLLILLFIIFIGVFGIACIIGINAEINSADYIKVAEMIEKNPAIKPEVDKLMEDNRITPVEFASLTNAEAKLRVKNAR
jgi:hypothetical protein